MPPSPNELLEFLIATLARKPPFMPFKNGASVARYLDDLAYAYTGQQRKTLLLLSKTIWECVFQFAEFATADKVQTIELLETFAQTHLADYDVIAAMRMVADHAPPTRHRAPRILRSRNLARNLSSNTPRLFSDLTERIYVAYWAFRLKRIHDASGLVAKALNRYRVPTGSREGDGSWSSFQVRARTKQFEARTKDLGNRKSKRESMVRLWEALYRSSSPRQIK